MSKVLEQVEGKRLYYKEPVGIPLDFDSAMSGLARVKPGDVVQKKAPKKKK